MNILKKLLFAFILLSLTQRLYAADIKYCWNDENDNLACGDLVPPKDSQGGYCLYKNGRQIDCVERAPTPEEILEREIQKKIKYQCEKQRKQDEELLAQFSSERDIELERANKLSSIDRVLQFDQNVFNALKSNLEDLLLSYERSQNHEVVTKNQLKVIQKNIENKKQRITENEASLQNKLKEREEINKEYDGYVQRYQDIMLWRKNNTPCELKVEQIIEIINFLMRIKS